jgi:hypothetical protein
MDAERAGRAEVMAAIRTERLKKVVVRTAANKLAEFVEARSFRTTDGELHVERYEHGGGGLIAVFAPGRWIAAQIVETVQEYDCDTGAVIRQEPEIATLADAA